MGTFVVTGAAGIVGTAVSTHLAGLGHDIIGMDLAAEPPGFPGIFIDGIDLTSAESTERGARVANDRAQSAIEGLANVAGGFRWQTIMDGDPDSWDFLYRINVMTAIHISRALMPSLTASRGAIVNVGANAALKAGPGMGAYAASKSAVARFTEALAEEAKGTGVRVNAVLPSIVDTPANRAEMGEEDAAKWVKPVELAQVIAFLLSDAASAITGASVPVVGRV